MVKGAERYYTSAMQSEAGSRRIKIAWITLSSIVLLVGLTLILFFKRYSAPAVCPAGSKEITSGNIAAELAGVPSGGTLCLNSGIYIVPNTILASKAVTILGINQPQIIQTFSNGAVFQISANDITIQGLKMKGANRDRTGESCSGTVALVIEAVSNINILKNTLDTFGCGIIMYKTDVFKVNDNDVSNIKYAAIEAYPATNGVIDGNTVNDLNIDGPLGENAYGIVASGDLSRNIVISNNTVNKAPTWECFDSHDGQSIDFLNNICVGPGRVGINLINSGNADPTGRIENNIIDAGGITSQWNSILHTGTGIIQNNTIKGFGPDCRLHSPNIMPSGNTCN